MKQQLLSALPSSLVISVAVLFAPATTPQLATPNMHTEATVQTLAATARPTPTPAFDVSNPFARPSTLPFKAPPFDKIKDSDFQPAIEEGMRRDLDEVELIANNPDAPTFANTIEALERTGEMLTRVQRVFSGMVASNTNPTIQKVQTEEAPKLAAHRDAIYLNPKLFARVKAVYDRRRTLRLAADAEYLVERYYRDFVRSGALLSDADKNTLRALNKEQSQLMDQFRNKVLADTNASALVFGDKAELAGLPEADIAAAAEAATRLGLAGKWVITLQNTTPQPTQTYLKNRAVRERLFNASVKRGDHGGDNDIKAIVERLAQLRHPRLQNRPWCRGRRAGPLTFPLDVGEQIGPRLLECMRGGRILGEAQQTVWVEPVGRRCREGRRLHWLGRISQASAYLIHDRARFLARKGCRLSGRNTEDVRALVIVPIVRGVAPRWQCGCDGRCLAGRCGPRRTPDQPGYQAHRHECDDETGLAHPRTEKVAGAGQGPRRKADSRRKPWKTCLGWGLPPQTLP